jgi:hypothetical protein
MKGPRVSFAGARLDQQIGEADAVTALLAKRKRFFKR